SFPSEYSGQFFFADYCNGWIRKLDPANGNLVSSFATNISFPVDLQVDDNGSLYYLTRGDSAVYRVDYTGSFAPSVTTHPPDHLFPKPQAPPFKINAAEKQPLAFQWQRNNVDIPGANAASFTLSLASSTDNGAAFRCVVSNGFGSATSNSAILTVTNNKP